MPTAKKKAAAKKTPAPAKSKPAARVAGKYVYQFGAGKADGNGSMKPLLGGKGAGIAEMKRIGVPVPDDFTVTTQACVAAMGGTSIPANVETPVLIVDAKNAQDALDAFPAPPKGFDVPNPFK